MTKSYLKNEHCLFTPLLLFTANLADLIYDLNLTRDPSMVFK